MRKYTHAFCYHGSDQSNSERNCYTTGVSVSRILMMLSAWLLTTDAAWAQTSSDPTPVPPAVMMIDNNKVNLSTAVIENQDNDQEVTIGDISNRTFTSGPMPISEWSGSLSTLAQPGVSGSMVNGFLEMRVQWGMHYHIFLVGSTQSSNSQGALYRDAVMSGPYFEKGAGNATLACTGGSMTQLYGNGGTCTVTEADGTQVNFLMGYSQINETNHIYPPGVIQNIVRPDGEIITLRAQNGGYYGWSSRGVRTSSDGLPAMPPTVSGTYNIVPGTYNITSNGYAINTAIDYCDQATITCTGGMNAIKTTYTEVITVDANSWVTLNKIDLSINGYLLKTTIPLNGVATPPCGAILCFTSFTNYTSFNAVSPLGVMRKYVRSGCSFNCTQTLTVSKQNTTSYQFYWDLSTSAPPKTTTVTHPDGSVSTYSFQDGVLMSATDGLNRTTKYQYFYGNNWGTTLGRPQISRVYAPNSPDANHGYTQYDYTHGALSAITVVPIDSSPALVTLFGITLTCNSTNYKICNKPQYVIDPKGNRTDYTYDPAHGGILVETLPADANGVRPQKRYSYTQLFPKILDANGNLVDSTPIWRLTRASECRSATAADPASCVGTAAEKVTTYAYASNNLFLTSQTVAAGDGSISASASYTYDYVGNLTSIDGPRTDVDDRQYYTYDGLRRKIFEISPDPDGTGPLPRLITHHVYDADGNEIRNESGTGNATDGSDFVVSKFKRMTYDSVSGLLVKVEEVAP